jgi:hypothetical protein
VLALLPGFDNAHPQMFRSGHPKFTGGVPVELGCRWHLRQPSPLIDPARGLPAYSGRRGKPRVSVLCAACCQWESLQVSNASSSSAFPLWA